MIKKLSFLRHSVDLTAAKGAYRQPVHIAHRRVGTTAISCGEVRSVVTIGFQTFW